MSSSQNGSKRTISVLVIEDEVFIRNMISLHLSENGCLVDTAENGKEGYARLKNHPADVILCDIMMPREDGLSFCRRIRSEGNTTPVLFLSSKSQSESVTEGLAAGADDYLVKPFDLEELSIRLHKLVQRTHP